MQMRHSSELSERSEQLYNEKLKGLLEPGHRGQFIAIEPESGDYYLGRSMIEVFQAAHKAHPERPAFVMRIGFPAAVEFGYAQPEG